MGSQDDLPEGPEVLEEYLRLLAANPDDARARLALNARLMKRAQEQGAAMRLRRPQHLMMLDYDKRMAGNDPKKLIAAYGEYLLQDPNHAAIRASLAERLLELGYASGAAAEAEMALKDDGTNMHAADVLVACYEKPGKNREAKEIRARIDQFRGGR